MKSVLSEMAIRKAKAKDRGYKMTDGGGMYLYVSPAGGKSWRLDYSFDKKRKTLSLGQYPITSLTEARDARLEAKKLLAQGIDPSSDKKSHHDQSQTFKAVAIAWHQEQLPNWSEKHGERLMRRMELDLFPFIGNQALSDLTANDVEATLKRVSMRSLDTAHRLKSALRGVFNFGIRKGYCTINPTEAMKGVLPTNKHRHMSAPTDPDQVGKLLRNIDLFRGTFVVHCALRIAPLVFARPGELRQMEWAELDLDRSTWSIPAEKMKMRDAHLVPLSTQVVAELRKIEPLTGHCKYVFTSRVGNDSPMSDATINKALRSLGYSREEITGHGFRAMARTMLDEILRFSPDAIEAQLAHRVPDRLGRAYNRTRHLDERVRMMQEWADYLERLKAT